MKKARGFGETIGVVVAGSLLAACGHTAVSNAQGHPEGTPLVSPAATASKCPDRGDPMPDPTALKYCPETNPAPPAPNETTPGASPSTPDDNGTVTPSQRYTPGASKNDCGPLDVAPTAVGQPNANGVPVTNGDHCVTIYDPRTGKTIGEIASGATFDVTCANYNPTSWDVVLIGGGQGEILLSPGMANMANEGTFPSVPNC